MRGYNKDIAKWSRDKMNRPVIKAIEGLGQLTDFPSMKQGDSKKFCGDLS